MNNMYKQKFKNLFKGKQEYFFCFDNYKRKPT